LLRQIGHGDNSRRFGALLSRIFAKGSRRAFPWRKANISPAAFMLNHGVSGGAAKDPNVHAQSLSSSCDNWRTMEGKRRASLAKLDKATHAARANAREARAAMG